MVCVMKVSRVDRCESSEGGRSKFISSSPIAIYLFLLSIIDQLIVKGNRRLFSW